MDGLRAIEKHPAEISQLIDFDELRSELLHTKDTREIDNKSINQ